LFWTLECHNPPIIDAGARHYWPSLKAMEDKKGLVSANYGQVGLSGCSRRQRCLQRRVPMRSPATKLPNSSAQSSWDEYVWLAAAENLAADVLGNIICSYSSCIPNPSSSGSLLSSLSSSLSSIGFPALDLSAWLMLLPPLPCLDVFADAAVTGDLVDGLFDASTSSVSWSLLGGLVLPAAPPNGWVVSDGGFADASAAFPGVVWPTLRGLDVINDIPSSENSSSSSKGITSGPFAFAAAFAVVRRGGFVRCHAPSRFQETWGNFPPANFGRFASAGPPSTAGLPSALAPAVLPMPILRVWPNFGAIVGAIFVLLELAGSRMLPGKK
jgi:hypothetical protein